MSILFKTGAIPALCLAATLGFATNAAAQDLQLRLSSENPPGGNSVAILYKFQEKIEEILGDEVSVQVFDSGVIGNEEVHLQQIRTGQIDIHSTGSDAIQLDPAWAIFDMPFLFDSRETVARVLDGEIGDMLAASMREAAGVQVLGFGEIGFRHMTNDIRPIVVPSDMAGMRVRIPGSEARAMMLETFGAVPVDINFGELYLALQQGTVDAQENPLMSTDVGSFQEVQDYLSLTSHVYTPITLNMNGAKYDSLTDEQRAAVHEAADYAIAYTRENGAAADERLMKEMAEEIAFNEVDIPAFREASAPVYDFIGGLIGPEMVEAILSAVSED